ncbi:MAG: GntR family transcriptional regulator [Peptococcaceae bacterium]|jgi:GntR family transcriptional regulator|nr:GntR family transcriptional regulator [Peptococcaceae bacterium]
MSWEFDSNRPIYLQLMEQLKINIITGVYPPGSKIPSVRDLAMETGVNPNTMQRALTELERENLLYSQRTNGRFVTEDEKMIKALQQDLAQQQIKEFISHMKTIGLQRQEIIDLLANLLQEGEIK